MHKSLILLLLVILFSPALSFANQDKWQGEWPNTDFTKSSIDLNEVMSGGPPKDGIPSIDNPTFKPVAAISNIKGTEPVISVNINGEARAYPLRILIWHEIVNDVVGGKAIVVTYCPLCNASIAFDREVDGEITKFGVSGKLHKSNMIMYDRKSESWWQQYSGEAIAGIKTGKKLRKIASRVESLDIFKTRFPDGMVMIPNDPLARPYGTTPYAGYDRSFPFLYKGKYGGKLPQMTYFVVVGNEAWPLPMLRAKGRIIQDDLVLKWYLLQNSALDSNTIDMGRDIGNVIVRKRQADGSLADVPYSITFAFVFDAFHPDGIVHME